jgi:hypothetical protein
MGLRDPKFFDEFKQLMEASHKKNNTQDVSMDVIIKFQEKHEKIKAALVEKGLYGSYCEMNGMASGFDDFDRNGSTKVTVNIKKQIAKIINELALDK